VRAAFSCSTLAGLLALMIRAYQLAIAPLLGPRCRFHPSCSYYALEALTVHGAVRGLGLSIARIGRCQPLTAGGFDPVPSVQGGHATGGPEKG
jgi:putative membrane protein insertion efficiency factor